MRRSGHAEVDVQKGVICMDDPSLGTIIYRLEDGSRLKSFPVKVTKKKRIRNVAFVDDCRVVVSGSDHGVVYLFDRRSGKKVDELKVHSYEWVQSVTVSANRMKILCIQHSDTDVRARWGVHHLHSQVARLGRAKQHLGVAEARARSWNDHVHPRVCAVLFRGGGSNCGAL